jgi:hypothetical protein
MTLESPAIERRLVMVQGSRGRGGGLEIPHPAPQRLFLFLDLYIAEYNEYKIIKRMGTQLVVDN